VREGLLATEQIGIEAVEQIHRTAGAFSFIRPETSLSARGGN
jgi:hypothetical protein